MKLPFFDSDMKMDHKILATEGVLGLLSGVTMVAHPPTAHVLQCYNISDILSGMQKHVFDKAASGGAGEGAATGGGESNGMTRVAGASLAAVSAYTMHAGLHGSAKERSLAYKVTAGQSAVGAGLGALALAGKRSDTTMSDKKIKVATGLLAVNAAYFGWRAWKNRDANEPVRAAVQKTGWGK